MRIKKFEGDTLQEALAKVKRDFGADAVILQTKKYVKGGVFGLFGRQRTEVTAGIDINVEKPRAAAPQPARPQPVSRTTPVKQYAAGGYDSFDMHRRVEDISMKNETLLRELNEGKILINPSFKPLKDSGVPSLGVTLKNGMGRLQKLLIDNGVEDNLVYRTLQNINSQLSETQINNKTYVDQYLYDYLAELIQVSGPIKTQPGSTKVVAFIGPTGVGKTTTIAKVAAKYALIEGKSAVMVSADTYRIGADIQLKSTVK